MTPIAAAYLGVQSGFGLMPDLHLYNLKEPLPDYPVGSTVSLTTIQRAGYEPAKETP